MAAEKGRAFVSEDFADVIDDANALIADGNTTLGTVSANITEIDDAGSDAQKHAQQTASFTDSLGATYDKGAKGYAQDAASSATDSAGSAADAETWAEGDDAAVALLGGTHSSQGWSEVSEAWAEEDEDVEVETGQYSAKHHRAKAEDAQAAAETAEANAETAQALAEDARDAARGTVSPYPARAAVSGAAAAFYRAPGSSSLVYEGTAGTFTTNAHNGFGIDVGTQTDGFDWVTIRALPDTGTLTGVWVGVRKKSGAAGSGPTDYTFVDEFFVPTGQDWRRDAPFEIALPYKVYDADDPRWWLDFIFVGKTMKAARNATGPGYWRYSATAAPSTDPAGTSQTGAVEVGVGLYAPATDGQLRLREPARHAMQRFNYGPSSPQVKRIQDVQEAAWDVERLWVANGGGTVGYVETFAQDDAAAGLSPAATVYTTLVDLSTLTEGANAGITAFQSADPEAAPVTQFLVAARRDVDGRPDGEELFARRMEVGTADAAETTFYPFDFEFRERGRATVGSQLVHVLVATDQTAYFLGKTGFVGANSYATNVAGAIYADNPWALLGPTPTSTQKGYLRFGRVASVEGSRFTYHAPGQMALEKSREILGRVALKLQALTRGVTTWLGSSVRVHVVGHGPSNMAQKQRWQTLARHWAGADGFAGYFSALVVGPGWITPLQEKEGFPAAYPYGVGDVDATGAAGSAKVQTILSGVDDGGACGIDGSVRIWAKGDYVDYPFPNGIKRLFLFFQGDTGCDAHWKVKDVTSGSTTLATVSQASHGDGARMACVTLSAIAPNTVLRVEREAGDTGLTGGRCRTLGLFGDFGGLQPELSLGKGAKGGAGLTEFAPMLETTATYQGSDVSYPYGRIAHLYSLESVSNTGTTTGCTSGVPCPTPDLVWLLPSDLDTTAYGATRAALRGVQRVIKTLLTRVAEGTRAGWANHNPNANGLTNVLPADLLCEFSDDPNDREPNPEARAAAQDAVTSFHTYPVGFYSLHDKITAEGDPLGYINPGDIAHMSPYGYWDLTQEATYCVLPRGVTITPPAAPTGVPITIANVTVDPVSGAITAGGTVTVEMELTDPDGDVDAATLTVSFGEATQATADATADATASGTRSLTFEFTGGEVVAGDWNLYVVVTDDSGLESIFDWSLLYGLITVNEAP